jgi:hypothetical protein
LPFLPLQYLQMSLLNSHWSSTQLLYTAVNTLQKSASSSISIPLRGSHRETSTAGEQGAAAHPSQRRRDV